MSSIHNGSDTGKTNGQLHEEKIAILDCGAQYGKLIDRKVRELNVESHIVPLNIEAKKLLQQNFKYLKQQMTFFLI